MLLEAVSLAAPKRCQMNQCMPPVHCLPLLSCPTRRSYVHPNGTYAGYAAFTAPGPVGPFAIQRAVTNVSTNNATWVSLRARVAEPLGAFSAALGSSFPYLPPPVAPVSLIPSEIHLPFPLLVSQHCGDFHLFVDDDGTPYIIMGCNFHMVIERLFPNMLDSTGECFIFPEYFIEAPMLFKRNGIYYALFDHCCCYCYQGSGVIVHTAPSPLGPWTAQSDVACIPTNASSVVEGTAGAVPPPMSPFRHEYESLAAAAVGPLGGEPTPGQGCQYANASTTSALRSQQSFISTVLTPTGTQYLWAGDRWQQSWDGTKGHDPQYWMPIPFTANGSISTMSWIDNFTIDVITTPVVA